MKCPKCGGEIPFYDLKPKCKHCGVNIMYFVHETELARDAKRAELDFAAARLVVARVKANFIGGKLQIARLVAVVLSIFALLLPFGGVKFTVPFFDAEVSIGALGLIMGFVNGSLMGILTKILSFAQSTLFGTHTVGLFVIAGFFVIIFLCILVILVAYLLGFFNLKKSSKAIFVTAILGACFCLLEFIAILVMRGLMPNTEASALVPGFGALAELAVLVFLIVVDKKLLSQGIEPAYKETDLLRKEMRAKVRKGEVDIDTLPLPIYETEEERQERLEALEAALIAEEEGKEQ